MTNRVVITGMGAITPIGNDVETFWENTKNGVNGISAITRFDTEDLKSKIAGEVKDFDPLKYMEKKETKRMDRFCWYGMAAAAQAMEQSGLDVEKIDQTRFGVIAASGIGGMETHCEEMQRLLEKGAARVSPLYIPTMIINMLPGLLAIRYHARGASFAVVSACASGTHAVGEAFRSIKHGYLDAAITGGAEAALTPLSVAGFVNLSALATTNDPEKASCPFDLNRSGFVMGEGAGMLVLESLEHAQKRGATILAEVVGYGATSDAYHMTAPDISGDGAARAMALAMEEAGITPQDVDYINAHGTSTHYNDLCETKAIKTAFGDAAKTVSISSTKSMMGHLLGAAGGVETIICAKALEDGFIPPTIHYETPDPELDLCYTPNVGKQKTVRYALSNSLGFGGHNATILLKKWGA